MAILCDKNTKLLIQGMGRMGQFHAGLSKQYGTQVAGGTAPGKGGTEINGIPIFDCVADAVKETGANASVVFVPPPGAADAILFAPSNPVVSIGPILALPGLRHALQAARGERRGENEAPGS